MNAHTALKRQIHALVFFVLVVQPFTAGAVNALVAAGLTEKPVTDSIPAHAPEINNKRCWLVAGAHIGLWAGSFVALNSAWYADYPRQSFHFFNDNAEWNQMDKAGHFWTAYQMSRLSYRAWKWTGLDEKKSRWLGAISGIAYQSIVEIQDGYSAEWGFSWGDMTANIAGAAAFLLQEAGWKDQRLQIKLSYHSWQYPEGLSNRRKQLFGSTIAERILKDYNSQTYWISANLKSFLPDSRLPRWLNISLGYGSNGMLGGFSNTWKDKDGNTIDRSDIARMRRLFIAPDIDLTKIHSNHKLIRTLLYIGNMIKIPAPALEWNTGKGVKLHVLYF